MSKTKIAITLDVELLRKVDLLVAERRFATRSRAIQEAIKAAVEPMQWGRLDRECAKLDPVFEQQLAEEGMSDQAGTCRADRDLELEGRAPRPSR